MSSERLCHTCQKLRPGEEFTTEGRPHFCNTCRSAANSERRARRQLRTIPGADRKGLPWESWEERYMAEHPELSNEDVAKHLQRTAYAIKKYRSDHGLGRGPMESIPITDYTEGRNLLETVDIRIEQQISNGRIAVWCHEDTTDEEIRLAFANAGIPEEQIIQWFKKRRPV